MDVGVKVRRKWQEGKKRERSVLKSFARHSPDAALRTRCKVVLSLVRGNTAQEIGRAGLCSVSQVYRVADRFVQEGLAGLGDGRQDNGESKITEEYEWGVLIAVAGSPQDFGQRRPTWTQELLIKVLDQQIGIHVSRTTMSRLLKKHGVRLGRPKPIVGCPWKKAAKTRRLRSIDRMIANLPRNEVVLYVDEVDIHLNPKIGDDWMLRGIQKQVLTPGKNEKRYLAGAYNPATRQLSYVEAERKTSDLFILLLWHLIKEYPTQTCIHIVLDNYRIHSSQRTALALASLGNRVRLHFLPPYCPDNNRIERYWKDLHANVTRNHNCRTMNELMAEVRAYLRSENIKRQRSHRKAA